MSDLSTRDGLVDYARSLDCIHCGLCLHTCPTYQSSGREASSPRGRIHLMRSVAEGVLAPDGAFGEEMDYCLVCRHCESVCPAGVQFGAMMEHTRDRLTREAPPPLSTRLVRWFGFRKLLPSRRLLRLAASGLRLAQQVGLVRLWARLFGPVSLAHQPTVPPPSERRPLPCMTPAEGTVRGSVSMLAGCVMPELFGRVNEATLRVLAASGVEVHVPTAHVCCGALQAHNGDLEGSRQLARATIAAFEETGGPVVVNSAGCGSHLKELGRILADDPTWSERARAFSARVTDLSEYLARPEALERLTPLLGAPEGIGRVAWDDPCHLCHGQQVRSAPRALLDAVPGLFQCSLEDPEACCGSAGIYSMLRPQDSAVVLDRKLDDVAQSGAQVLVTGNPGCHLQLATGVAARKLPVEVLHLAEVLDRSLQTLGETADSQLSTTETPPG